MFKQKNGRTHNIYRGYKRGSGRCAKCDRMLNQTRGLPLELREIIAGYYRSGLRRRISQRGLMVPRYRRR
jgi:hypothetical protein